MNLKTFKAELAKQNDDERLLDSCRKYVLHGTPYVFHNNEEAFYEFRKRISIKFNIPFHEVYIMGSGKLGFSPHKNKIFDYDSDIDVALISSKLFEKIMRDISRYQMRVRKARAKIQDRELFMYHEFLEYVALGWIRPDKLPVSFQMKTIKDEWFEFFKSISYGKSEIGNYKVSAGVFKTYEHLEDYIVSGLRDLQTANSVRKNSGSSN